MEHDTNTRQRDPLLTQQQAAEQLGVKVNTLQCWRSTGRYALAFTKVGGYVRYRQSAIDAFLASRTMTSTPLRDVPAAEAAEAAS